MGRLLPYKALGTLRMAREAEARINAHRNFVINARREPLQQAANRERASTSRIEEQWARKQRQLQQAANRERAARWALSAANRYLDEAMSAATATVAATKGGSK